MSISWYEDLTAQVLSGVTISLADRYFSRESGRKSDERREKLIHEVASIEYIKDVAGRPEMERLEEINSTDYRMAIEHARDYLQSNRVSVSKPFEGGLDGMLSRVSERVRKFRDYERINSLSAGRAFTAAFGIQFVGDLLSGMSSLIWAKGNALASLGQTLYQAPAMGAGFMLGRGILYVNDFLFKSKEDKQLRAKAKELIRDEVVIDAVRKYGKVKHVKNESSGKRELEEASEDGEDISKPGKSITVLAGEKLGGILGREVDGIKEKFRARREEKEKEEQDRRENLKKKYDGY